MNQGLVTVIVVIVFTVLSGFVLLLRCISRFIIVRKAGTDDILAILACLASVATTCLICDQYRHGLGRDIQEVAFNDVVHLLRDMWASIITYTVAVSLLKISAICQYLRFLFEPKTRILCWVLLVVCAVYGVVAIIATIFECSPIAFSWDHSIPGGKCIRLLALWYTTAALCIITDVIVVAIPILAIKNMNMPIAQKRALVFVFALGGFGCITSILRLRSIYFAATSPNYTRDNAEAARWSSIEINVGIICTSLPPLKALIVAIWPNFLARQSSDQSPDGGPSFALSTEATLVAKSATYQERPIADKDLED